jgi:PAS domain S-box-containing protein
LADITERRAAELALQDSENRLRLAMDAGGMGAWQWDIATGQVKWSETLETIHGLAPGSFGGTYQDFLADIHPDDRQRAIDAIQQSMTQDFYEIEYRIVRPDGRIRWLGARGQPIYNRSGERERMIGVCMDITARKEQEDALREALEAKDEFLGVMSHELRTPITAIYGGARMLRSREDRLDEQSRREILQDIEGESERLFGMVENLLTLSRLELGATVATEPLLLQRAIDKVVRTYRARRPNCEISVNIPDDLDPVAAQPAWVELIVRNLISNADKYSPDGSPVEIRARRAGGEVEVLVLDRGPGVAPDESEQIFQAFYRSEKAARRAGGIGMGLTVCKRLTEAQDGRIWASPREGGGLEIGFTLPALKEE